MPRDKRRIDFRNLSFNSKFLSSEHFNRHLCLSNEIANEMRGSRRYAGAFPLDGRVGRYGRAPMGHTSV